jgi:hypothetical protein
MFRPGMMSALAIFRRPTSGRAVPPCTQSRKVCFVCGSSSWGNDRWLRDAFLAEDKSKQIVAVSFALETESPFCLLVRRFCPILRRALLLPCLNHNFLRVESRATLVSKLYGDVVVEFMVRRATANIS